MGVAASLGLLALGVALVVAGAEILLDGILAAAERLPVSPFALTVLVSGFELENLAAGIAANAKGLPGAAAGTFLGGTTFLAAGVAGIGALIAPIRSEPPGAVLAWTAAAPLPLLGLSLDGRLSRLDGAVLVAWFVPALVGLARAGGGALGPAPPASRRRPALLVLGGLLLLGGGGEALGEGLRRVVERLGVSATLLGNTAVAAAVEAEEVARVAAPARRGRGELALGTLAGTVVHFVALNAGVIALVRPLPLDEETRHLHLPAAVAATLLLCATARAGRGIGRPAGAVLVLAYAAYLVLAVVTA
jgi:cation:H+ antiporter